MSEKIVKTAKQILLKKLLFRIAEIDETLMPLILEAMNTHSEQFLIGFGMVLQNNEVILNPTQMKDEVKMYLTKL